MVTTSAVSIGCIRVVLLVSSTDHLFGREHVPRDVAFWRDASEPCLHQETELFRAFQQRRITVAAVSPVRLPCL